MAQMIGQEMHRSELAKVQEQKSKQQEWNTTAQVYPQAKVAQQEAPRRELNFRGQQAAVAGTRELAEVHTTPQTTQRWVTRLLWHWLHTQWPALHKTLS